MWLHNGLVTRDHLKNPSSRGEKIKSRSQLWLWERGHFPHRSSKEIQQMDVQKLAKVVDWMEAGEASILSMKQEKRSMLVQEWRKGAGDV